jgi:hypothetical protein
MASQMGPDGLLHNKQIPYPTLEDVNKAGRYQLGFWYRFLPSPGMAYVGTEHFKVNLDRESEILHRIDDRFHNEFGGMDSKLSKELGWEL